jgi:septal ring factor EnvC (AmiA/AmiB activator)
MDVALLFTALEERIGRLIAVLARVTADNGRLEAEVAHLKARVADLEERCGRWEQERGALGQRIERLLAEIDALPHTESEGAQQSHELADRLG